MWPLRRAAFFISLSRDLRGGGIRITKLLFKAFYALIDEAAVTVLAVCFAIALKAAPLVEMKQRPAQMMGMKLFVQPPGAQGVRVELF